MKKKSTKKQSDLCGHKFMMGFGVVLVLMFAGILYVGVCAKPPAQNSSTAGPIPIYFQNANDAMPFPATVDPTTFKDPLIHEAYQLAKDIP